jgi:hypothetical protein
MSEARVDRLARLEEDVRDIKATLGRLEPMLAGINAVLPHLATKAELTTGLADLRSEIGALRVEIADKPSRGYLWGVMGAMVGAQAVALAAAALIFSIIQTRPAPAAPPGPHANAAWIVLAGEPFDWDRYHDRQDACREADRIAAQCTRGYCDELALRSAQRACSAFTGERR